MTMNLLTDILPGILIYFPVTATGCLGQQLPNCWWRSKRTTTCECDSWYLVYNLLKHMRIHTTIPFFFFFGLGNAANLIRIRNTPQGQDSC